MSHRPVPATVSIQGHVSYGFPANWSEFCIELKHFVYPHSKLNRAARTLISPGLNGRVMILITDFRAD